MSAFLLLLAALVLMASGSVLTFGWLIARHRRIRARQVESLLAHMARHPAGSRVPEPSWPIRARPCRCELHISRLDAVEAEYAELIHIQQCPVARELIERNAA